MVQGFQILSLSIENDDSLLRSKMSCQRLDESSRIRPKIRLMWGVPISKHTLHNCHEAMQQELSNEKNHM